MFTHTRTHTHQHGALVSTTQNLRKPGTVVDTGATKMNANRSVFEDRLNNLALNISPGRLLAFTTNHSAKQIINYIIKLLIT